MQGSGSSAGVGSAFIVESGRVYVSLENKRYASALKSPIQRSSGNCLHIRKSISPLCDQDLSIQFRSSRKRASTSEVWDPKQFSSHTVS